MSTIKSSSEHLTLNADGASKDIKFQANGVEKASISSAGAFTSTTIDATALTGALPAISAASLTNVPAANITGTLPAIDGSSLTGISAGITEADQWRLTTSFAGDASPISSNLERNDTDFEKIGTGMSQSSGIFSFPSTGKWQVSFQAQQYSNHTEDYGVYLIKVTTDNSQYEPRCKIVTGTSTAVTFSSGYGNCIVDVTDTSNVKVKFDVFQAASSNKAYAHSDYNYTAMTFLKLGET